MSADLTVVPSADALADAAAARFVAAADEAIHARGRFVIALSGGSTPRRLYQRLAAEPLTSRVAWSRVQVLWGDERCVPPADRESNYRMARETLLDHVPVPPAHVHRIRGEEPPAAAAARYEAVLRTLFVTPQGPPRGIAGAGIDLVLLGLGEDGHTASLFPGSAAAREQARWVMAECAPAVSMWRITLTPPVLLVASTILFLVSGDAKAGILRQVLEGPPGASDLPAGMIARSAGRVCWLVDAAAAAQLGPGSR